MSTPTFAETHNLIAFLEKLTKSDGFEQIIDFPNANPIKYALTVSPTIYTSCIKQFLTFAKAKTVNDDVQIQALVNGKKVVVNEASIRRNLRLDDAEGTACLPNAAIFEELARIGAKTTAWNEFSSTMASAVIYRANNQKFNFSKYILKSMVKNLEAGINFLMYLRFLQVFINNQLGDMSHHKAIFVNPSLTKKKKHKSKRKHKKEIEVSQDESPTEEHILTPSHNPLPSGEDKLQLNELMEICTKFSDMVLSLEQTKTNQAAKIEKLKKRVKKLEGKKKKKKRTHWLKRLYKAGLSARIVSSDKEGLGDQEDASKQERSIADIDQDKRTTLDATVAEKEISTVDLVTTAGEVVTTTEDVEVAAAFTIPQFSKDELTLAQTLMEIKAAKPKAKEVTIQEPSEFRTTSSSQPSQPPQAKDKDKGIMVEPEKPLKIKDQIALDEEVARKLEDKMKAKMEEEERIAREKAEANIAIIANDDTAELKRCLEIVSEDDEDVTIEATPISSKSPTIVDYKIYREGKKSYFKIIKADGNLQNYLTFRKMFKNFKRENLEVLRSIVKERFKKTKPVDDMDNLLFQTLKTMFKHHIEDNI
nr:hypothetical protein [Tanacetum cinerariifolium]